MIDRNKEFEKDDPLAAARGIFNGCLIGLVFWGILIGVMYFVSK